MVISWRALAEPSTRRVSVRQSRARAGVGVGRGSGELPDVEGGLLVASLIGEADALAPMEESGLVGTPMSSICSSDCC